MGSKKVRDTYFAEILAERLSIDDQMDESPLERGLRLEDQAIAEFEAKTGKIVEKIGFIEKDDNEFTALSPDGLIQVDGLYKEAIEIKCLSSAKHIQAWIKNEIPEDYYPQAIQYFIVNDDLEKLHFILYDPRVMIMPMHIITLNREDIKDDIADYQQKQEEFIAELEQTIEKIINF